MTIKIDDLLGKQFEYGGRGPERYDCYGLVCEVYRRYGIELPDITSTDDKPTIAKMIAEGEVFCVKLAKPEIPCIVTFSVIPRITTHIGVVIDNDRFIHIMQKTSVSIERLSAPDWSRRISGLFRWIKNSN